MPSSNRLPSLAENAEVDPTTTERIPEMSSTVHIPRHTVRPHNSSISLMCDSAVPGEWKVWGWANDLEDAQQQASALRECGKQVLFGLQFVESLDISTDQYA